MRMMHINRTVHGNINIIARHTRRTRLASTTQASRCRSCSCSVTGGRPAASGALWAAAAGGDGGIAGTHVVVPGGARRHAAAARAAGPARPVAQVRPRRQRAPAV